MNLFKKVIKWFSEDEKSEVDEAFEKFAEAYLRLARAQADLVKLNAKIIHNETRLYQELSEEQKEQYKKDMQLALDVACASIVTQ